jgi:MFS family permease
MFAGYFLTDVMSPLKSMLEAEFKWSSTEYGIFTSAYGWLNVFFLMLLFGGLILDKMGVRFTGLMSAGVMVLGASIKYWAISHHFPEGAMIFGIKSQVVFASIGFTIFGVGVEVGGITVSKIVVKWFKGYELALAMGLQVAIARIGTLMAMAAPVPLATYFDSISAPIALALILLVAGFLSFFFYIAMDKKPDISVSEKGEVIDEEPFHFSDIGLIVKNTGFWLISLLCVLFYSAIFPFLKFAADLMVNKYGLAPDIAGYIPGALPLGTLILTPLFGSIYDKKGKGATIMLIGAVMLIFIHAFFSLPILNTWVMAVILVVLLGVALSLVPSAMWPAVSKIIPDKQLGTAFSLIFWIQNWGLMGVPLLIGWVLDKYCITGSVIIDGNSKPTYDYTIPMLIFTTFGILAVVVSLLLKADNLKKGYGLEEPNIQK